MKKLLSLALLACALTTHGQIINTLAGNGISGYSGDGGAATSASLFGPYGITSDAAGNVYFSDRFNHRVRKVSTTGTITTICGTGTAGYNGDGIAATAAQLNDPNGVAADAAGNIYIADRINHRVRKVDVSGNITTVIGNGTAGYSGDDAAATAAMVSAPRGLATDAAGNVYIADQDNYRIRKITVSTGIVSTVAGIGTAGFSGDGGPATAASFNGLYALTIDAAGNMYICDVDNQRIRKVNTAGIVSTFAGTGTMSYNADNIPATDAHLNEPIGVAADPWGNIYIADAWNSRIRKVNTSGTISTIAGSGVLGDLGDGGQATAARFYYTYGIALTNTGRLLISDHGNNRVRYIPMWTVGIGNNAAQPLSMSIFPNPSADGKFILDCSAFSSEQASVTIIDISGRTVYTTATIGQQSLAIQLPGVASIYIASVTTATGSNQQHIVISGQ